MKKILLLCTMLLSLVAGKAQNQQAEIQNDGNGDYVLIPYVYNSDDVPTSELDLTGKAVGYSFKIYDASGPGANYYYYWNGYLLITIPNGMVLNISGTVKANSNWESDRDYEYLGIFNGATTDDDLFGLFGKPSGEFVSVVGDASNVLLQFKSFGWGLYEGVDVTATLAVKEGGFVYADNDKTHLINYVGEDDEITIPSTVTNIDGNAFFGCEDLTYNESEDLNYLGSSTNPYLFLVGPSDDDKDKTEYIINSDTKCIGSEAFKGCSNLVSLNVPQTVVSIGNDAFAGLKNVVYNGSAGTIYDSWGATMRNGVQEGDFFLGSNGAVIGEYLGSGGDIVIPVSVQIIRDNIFNDKNISSVDFSQATGLTTIGDYAFSNCDGLTTVTIPASVTTMGYGVFDGCDYISVIYCAGESRPDGWDYNWNYGCFSNYGWDHLPTLWDYTNWNVDDNGVLTFNKDYDYNSYDQYPWYALRSQIKSVKVGADVTTIGYQAFYNGYTDYENLVSVDFSEAASLNTIGSAAFYRSNLTTVTIPATLTTIESSAFRESHSLESVDFSNAEALSSIGYSAFENCIALTEADMENATGLVAINGQAFYGCYGLTTLNIPQTVTYIGYQAFQGVKNINYKGSAGSSMEKWGALARNGYVEDGFVYSDNTKTTLVAYIGDGGSVNIPAGVVTIGHLSFFNCTTLTAVSIPSSVEYIGSDAFSSCSSLSTVDMSNATNLHYIDNSAFSGCAALASISIPQSIIRVGYGAFDNCNSSLLTEQNGFYYLGNSSNPYLVLIKPVAPGNISTLTVENGVKAVAYGAFSGCTDFPITEDGASYVGSTTNPYLILAKASSSDITSCTINSNTKLVAPEAFWGCYGLSYTTITIPEGIEFMGYRAFGYGGGSSPYFVTNECSQPARWDDYWNYNGGRVVWGANSYQIDGDGVLTINKNVEANDYTYYPWYSEAESITKVVFTGDVSHVGNYAFYNGNNEYYNLKQVVIPSTMKTIGDNAFQYSYYLTDINLGDATELTSIGGYAFYNCSSLETIEIPSSVTFIGEYAFNDCYNMDYNESEGISYLGNTSNPYLYMASVNSGSDEQYTINANTRFIGSDAFSGCSNMSSITIPASVTSIGNYAFNNCASLISIDVPATVTYIEEYAFNGVSNVNYNGPFGTAADTWGANARNGSIDDNFVYADATRTTIIRYIGSDTEVTIPASVETIGNHAFEYKGITSVDFSQATQLIQIGEYAFHNTNLTEVSIPASVETIGARAFYECYSLESIDFSNATNLATIDQYAFCNCHSLSSVAMPESVEFIGSYAFSNCISLTEVSIPASVKTLGYGAFSACVTLTDVDFSQASSLQSISDYVFNSCYNLLCSIEIPSSVSYISSYAFDGIKNIIYNGSAGDADNKFGALTRNGTFENNFVFADEAKTALTGYTCKSGSVTIPDGVKTIGAYAFDKCSDVTVTIPSSLSISSIGEYAFNDIVNVINYNSYETNSPWGAKNYYKSSDIDIDENGFIFTAGSERTELIGYMGLATDVVIPQTVTSIADETFYNFNITSVDFSSAENLESIGQYAFYNCDNLTSVCIPATVTFVGFYAFSDCDNLTIRCEAPSLPDGWDNDWNPYDLTVLWDINNWSLSDDGLLTIKKSYNFDDSGEYPWSLMRNRVKAVKFEAAVTEIGYRALRDYDNLVTVDFSNATGLTTIGSEVFYSCGALSTIDFSGATSLETIGNNAFYDCPKLETIDLSNTTSLETIGNYAFYNCDNLESVTIPAAVTEIGDYAFNNCSSLATVEISDNASLTSIGDYAFAYCRALATIDLSKATSLDEIGQQAFYDCDALTSITIPASVTTMGSQLFWSCDYLPIIYCVAASATGNWGDWNYSNWNYIPVAWDCNNWSLSSDGLLTVKKQYNFESKEAYPWYELRSQITGVEFDNSNTTFTSIGKYAFNGYTSLQTATIPAGVTAIGDYAFYNCSNLKVVDLDNNTTLAAIGDYAFYSCYNLQSLTIPSSVTSIGGYAFYNCQKLATVDLSNLTSLESIGSWAFYNCDQLASVYLPISVLSVGESAFSSCDNLELIYIEAEKLVPDGWSSNWSNSNNVAWDCTNWSLSASGKLTIKKQFTAENAQDYPWYKLRSQITSVEFDNSNATFTAIGNYAFYGCDNLTAIDIPATVESIGNYAFYGCYNLTAIDIPATVESIGNYAFYGCQKLESVELSDNASLKSIGYQSFCECNALADIDLSKATSLDEIGEEAFYNCDGLTTITIPASVSQMGSLVFNYSDNLQFISCEAPSFPNNGWDGNWNYVYNTWNYLPVLWDCNNVSLSEEGMLTVSKDYEFESYDNYPWYNLKGLIKGVTFESGVTVIGDYAFYSWGTIYPNLATVVIPATVAEIGEEAFYYCQNLTSADLKGAYGLTTIGNYAFYECGLTEITIPANVTTIEEGAFEYCSNVESINLSGATSLETIKTNAFYGCFKTFNIDVPSNVTYIGSNAFYNIKNLKYNGSYGSSSDTWGALARNAYVDGDFIYSDGTKTYLLGYTGNGGNITIPSTVVTIGDNAFYQKENITGVVITGNVMKIGSSAFAGCTNLATLNLSNATNLTTIGSSAFSGCNELTSVTIPSTVTSLGSSAFSSCEKLATADLSNATNLTTIGSSAFSGCKELTSVTIPSTVTSLGSSAFSSCEKLATADLSNATSLEYIDNDAFYGCSALQSIVIPSKVQYIGSYAFQNCTSLRTVNLNNATGLYQIYNNAFDGCYNLYTIDLSKTTNLEYISSYVFRDCDALTQVTIPAKVGSISDGAFCGCNNLATVNMSNAKNLTYIGYNAFQECALTSVAIPENVTEIGDYAFGDCSSLSSVSIPNGIIRVGEDAFSGCSNQAFNVQNGFCYLGNSQNQYVVLVKPVAAGDLSSCTVNSGVKIVAVGAFNDCTVFPTTENGACYVGNNSNPYLILARAESQDISSCTINSNTRIIAPHAFWNCYSLSSLDIPAGVEHVGYCAVGYSYGGAPEVNCYTGDPSQWDGAWNPYGNNTNWAVGGWEFNEVSGLLTVKTDVVLWSQSYYPWFSLRNQIKSVKFTENVSRIGNEAFYNYTNMKTVDFSNASGLESIGKHAFRNTYYLDEADLSGATNLKSIGYNAFYNDYLKKIVVPASVEEIGEYAFRYCTTNVALCEGNGPAEGWDDNWTDIKPIWHYNNIALNLSVNNSSYGSVRTNTVNDEDVNQVIPNGIYTYGDVVSIEAVSNSGSIFLRWNDGVTDNQRDITITDNLSFEAIFGSDGTVYTVNVGTNDSDWGTVTGTGNYVSGDYVELEALPAEHYHFVRWSDDEENTNPNRSFYIASDVSYSAVFEPDPCMVTVNVTGNGTVENEAQYGYATCPTIYAYPEEGWYLAYWTTPDGNYFDNNCYFGVYEDMTLTAVFKPVQNVTVGTNIVEAYGRKYNNCKFEAEVSGEYVIYGSSFNNYPYIYVCDAYGYELASASGSGRITIDLEAGETYYIGAGNNNSAIEKMQLFIMASVSITAQGNGGTFEGDGEYTYGDDVTVTATPNEGMFFVKWSDGENKNVYSLKAYGNTTLNAEFSAIHQAVEGDNTVVGFYSGVTENYNCQFTPSYSGPYVFFSQSENDTYGILYDENKTVLESDDNSGENGNFSFTYELTAGQTYYIAASYVYTGNAGDEMDLVIGTPVNVTATVDGNGSVQGTGMYAYGSKVTLRANPESGNRFVRWSDLSTANPYQFTVYEDVELQAIFADESEDVYAVSAVVNNNSYGSVSGGSNYTAGERVELAVTANSGYTFICWTDGNSQNPRVFNASENVSLMAVLTPEGTTVHTVSATANDANMGNVTGGRYYADGETATISAVPVSGYKFVRWNDGTTTNPLVFTVTGDTEIEAMFVDGSTPVYTVTVGVASASANFGSVSGGGVFISGEPVSLTATAVEHYQFVKWSNNETSNPYNFNVSSNVDVAAVFEPMNYNVTVVAENGIVTNGDGPRKYGTWTTISVQPAEHYHFVGWADGETLATRTEQVLGDIQFTALFEKDKYTINAWADNDATVSGTGEYEYEATATLTVTPIEGYHFEGWTDDATAGNPRQIVVDRNLDLYATTAINQYQVTVEAANGSVEGITNPYNHGSEGTFTAVPAEGYRFVRWSATNRENPFTMQITSNVVLRPLFASPDDDVYDVVVSATEGGAVTGGGIFLKDEKTTITATPDQGYHFVKWSNGQTESSFELTVTESVNIKAEFDKNVHTLTVHAGANGTVAGGGSVEAGSSAEISATAAEGYHFVKWSDGNTSASRTVVVDKDIELTAEFAINTYAVKASGTNGKVEGIGTYNHGAEATLTAVANEGYHFVKWADGVETATRKATVTSDTLFTAEFAINTYVVKVTAANGTVTGEGTYEHGAKAKLNVTAAEGYHFVKWSDGETKATRTVVVTDNLTLTAEFEINSYTVSASATNGTVEGTGTYNYGAEATLTATANTGYRFSKWSDGVETATRKVTVKSDLSFTAEFAVNTYTISVDSAANGTITGAGTYTYGATATLEATANKGYHFVMWTDSVMTATRTVEVTGNATFSAVFAGDSYELTVKAKNGTVEGAGTYENGTEATLTAVADAGYIFSKWDDDNTDNPRTVTVTGNKTYTATFKKALYSVTVNAENGQITGAADSLELGATVTLTAIADEGYHFVMWSDSVTENPRTVTLTAELLQQVKDSIEFTAIFEINTDVADEAVEAVNIFAYGNTIVVENAVSDIFVYTAMGRLIERVAAEAGRTEIKINGAGIYVVKTGNTAKRVMIND